MLSSTRRIDLADVKQHVLLNIVSRPPKFEAFVQRIEVDHDGKQYTVYLYADLQSTYQDGVTRVTSGDCQGEQGSHF